MITAIRKMIRASLDFSGRVLIGSSRRIYRRPQEIRNAPWFRDEGDKTWRLNYELKADDVVFDLGGYEGQWASDIHARSGCTVHVFEPVPAFAENIRRRFHQNSKIQVHDFGLAACSRRERLFLNADGTSLYRKGDQAEEISLVSFEDFTSRSGVQKIDLMKINIEGGEYELLEHLIQTGWVEKITDIQIQFHDIFPDAEVRMKKIQAALARSHDLTYQYVFVWENWHLRNSNRPASRDT